MHAYTTTVSAFIKSSGCNHANEEDVTCLNRQKIIKVQLMQTACRVTKPQLPSGVAPVFYPWSRQVTIDSNRHVGSRRRRFSPNPHRRSPPRRPCGRQMTNIHGQSVNRCLVTRQIMTNIHGLKTESS